MKPPKKPSPWDIACPVCGAEPDRCCKNPNSDAGISNHPHKGRVWEWEAQYEF